MHFKNKAVILIVSLLFLSIFFIKSLPLTGMSVSDLTTNKIDPVVEKQAAAEGSAKVIVKVKNPADKKEILENLADTGINDTISFSLVSGFSAEVSSQSLEELKKDPKVSKVTQDYEIYQTLVTTRPLTNASVVQNSLINTFNITGKGLSACVIDSGVYNHSAFDTRLRKEVCYCSATEGTNSSCCPDGTSLQTSGLIGDNNGHGTHIAGIIASNDNTYKGIAPEAGIVSVKVLNSSGSGTTSDLISAMEFCINNRTAYNISVISLSLGCSGGFTSTCDSSSVCDSDSLATLVNSAVAKNITVVAAAGNSGSTNQMLSPACITNVTSVSSTDKNDAISSFSNRNSFTDLLAPGGSISSTYNTGGFATGSGTSQATPHVSGAILLLQNYKNRENGTTYSPFALQSILNNTGIPIYDSSTGVTFSRIQIFNAAVQLDALAPSLTLTEPRNTIYSTNTSLSLNYTATDSFLDKTFYSLDNQANVTLNGNTTFNVSYGTHTLILYTNDSKGNLNSTSVTFTTSLSPTISFASPTRNSTNNPSILINLTNSSNTQTIVLFNGTANETYTQPITRTYSAGTYTLIAYANTSTNIQNQTNFTFTVDLTPPQITILSPANTSYSINSVLINLSGSNDIDTFSFFNGTGNETYTTEIYRTFPEGSTTLIAYANDSAGNSNQTSVTFSVDSAGPIVSFISPTQGQAFRTNFIVNVSVQDTSSGVNASAIYYLWQNSSTVSSWIQLTNVSKDYWNATFNLSSVAEGSYTLKVNASDLLGTQSVYTLLTVTKDTTSPVQSAISASTSGSSATISWTSSESGNSSLSYGTSTSLGSFKTSSSSVTSHSLSLTSLTSTTYSYNVTTCDTASNCQTNGTYNFTIGSSSTSSSDSGGSSSGGASGGGGGGSSKSKSVINTEETPAVSTSQKETPAVLPAELEDTINQLYENETFSQGMIEVSGFSFDKKIITKDDESTLKLFLNYTGINALQDVFIYLDLPKSFSEKARDINLETQNEKLVKIVKEDPSFMVVYPALKTGDSKTIQLHFKKTLDVSLLAELPIPKIYTSKITPPQLSLFTKLQLSLEETFGDSLRYWWIALLGLILFISLLFYFADDLKYKLGIGYPPRSQPPHE